MFYINIILQREQKSSKKSSEFVKENVKEFIWLMNSHIFILNYKIKNPWNGGAFHGEKGGCIYFKEVVGYYNLFFLISPVYAL